MPARFPSWTTAGQGCIPLGLLGVILLGGGACASDAGTGPPPTPTTLAVTAGNGQTATAGTVLPVAPSVTVLDQNGAGLAGVSVIFSVSSGGGSLTGSNATTNAAGVATVGSWTLGTAAGTNTIAAATAGLNPVTLSATGVAGAATQMAATLEGSQTAPPNQAVGSAPAVRVRDQYGNTVAGVTVTFTPSAGGSVAGSPATTNAAGVATVGSWTITGGGNLLTASAPGLPDVTFLAIGTISAYSIALDFRTAVTASQRAAFVDAAVKWMSVITGDLADIDVPVGAIPANVCGNNPAFSGTIDDLYLWAFVEPIDGAGGILGQAGPCFVRTAGSLSLVGLMRFDSADLANLEAAGTLGEVILHEMGHVLGVGTLWNAHGLLQNPSCGGTGSTCNPDNSGADTYFSGAQAIAQFDAVGGTGWMPPTGASSKVPVENTAGGRGTRDGHWRESTFGNELMTGFIGAAGNPLSTVTAASLADMGYTIDLAGADSYALANPSGVRAALQAATIELRDDILLVPLHGISDEGVVRRIR